MENLEHYIPTQGPILNFIHHNTLHAFQTEHFEDAIRRASNIYGARYLPTKKDIEQWLREGKITEAGLRRANAKIEGLYDTEKPHGFVAEGIRRNGFLKYGVGIEGKTQPILFKLLARFLDQGISSEAGIQSSFWEWVKTVFSGSLFNFSLFQNETFQKGIQKDPHTAMRDSLLFLVKQPQHHERYQIEILLSHPGWSGLVHQVELNPDQLFERRKVSLQEVVSFEILLDEVIAREIVDFQPLEFTGQGPLMPSEVSVKKNQNDQYMRKLHSALEWSYYLDIAQKLENKRQAHEQNRKPIHAFFCLDDRECSVRRHLESVDPETLTYGIAGFYNLDCKILEAGYPYPVQSCPVILKPQVLIREEFIQESAERTHSYGFFHHHHLSRSLNHPLLGLWWTPILGVKALAELTWNLLTDFDTSAHRQSETRLRIDFEGERDGLRLGYTVPEMADRVFSLLRNSGFHGEGAELVVLFGHEASSNNNPHFAAYDCGACSGRSGAQNARAFAMMANREDVRAIVREKGLFISQECRFVGGVHNTTRDEVTFFDVEQLLPPTVALLNRWKSKVDQALLKNAKERILKFELVDTKITEKAALLHVKKRSVALFEPRPELNHAMNALCIVGRRSLTSGMSLERRSFLHSYDYASDPQGTILTGILNAVVPVCGGINLEYYFSRMDNEVYGAGTKLPHNVIGLFGVSNGVSGDLQTGLPSQMVELHDPIRLLIVVEHEPEIVLQAIKRNPATYEWVENEWVKFAAFSPRQKKIVWIQGDERAV